MIFWFMSRDVLMRFDFLRTSVVKVTLGIHLEETCHVLELAGS